MQIHIGLIFKNIPEWRHLHLQVMKGIKQLVLTCPNKQCKLDPVPTSLVKRLLSNIHSFKKSIVTPLLKKNSLEAEILQNYWPISNLSFI